SVSPKGQEKLARLGVPEFHRLVVTGSGQTMAIRAEADFGDRLLVSLEEEEFLAGGCGPDGHPPRERGLLATADDTGRNQTPAVRAKRHAGDPTVLREHSLLRPLPGKESRGHAGQQARGPCW